MKPDGHPVTRLPAGLLTGMLGRLDRFHELDSWGALVGCARVTRKRGQRTGLLEAVGVGLREAVRAGLEGRLGSRRELGSDTRQGGGWAVLGSLPTFFFFDFFCCWQGI